MIHSHSIRHPQPVPGTPDLERVICDYCGADQPHLLASLLPLDRLPFAMHRLGASALNLAEAQVDFCRCARCGLVYMNPRLTEPAIARFYDRVYGAAVHAGFESDQAPFVNHLLDALQPHLSAPAPSLLDIGCGAGQFLKAAAARGWRIHGTELSQVAAARASAALGVPIHVGDFRAAGFEPGSFDAVALLAVVEHLRAPVDYLRESAALLKPGGVLLLALPNVDSWEHRLARLTGQQWRGFILEHLYYFSPSLMTRLLADLGLDILRMTTWNPSARLPNPLADIRAMRHAAHVGADHSSPADGAASLSAPPLPPVSLPRRVLRQANNYLLDAVSTLSQGRRQGNSLGGNELYIWARNRQV